VATDGVIDEHFLMKYRALLDAEAAAFDELEHAFEDGDRERFVADMSAWQSTLTRKLNFLTRAGIHVLPVAAVE
jgi:hypothetical protein